MEKYEIFYFPIKSFSTAIQLDYLTIDITNTVVVGDICITCAHQSHDFWSTTLSSTRGLADSRTRASVQGKSRRIVKVCSWCFSDSSSTSNATFLHDSDPLIYIHLKIFHQFLFLFAQLFRHAKSFKHFTLYFD